MLVILGQWEYLYDCLKDTTLHNIIYKLSRLNASIYNVISYYGVGA